MLIVASEKPTISNYIISFVTKVKCLLCVFLLNSDHSQNTHLTKKFSYLFGKSKLKAFVSLTNNARCSG